MTALIIVWLWGCGDDKDSALSYDKSSCENYYQSKYDCESATGNATTDYSEAAAEVQCQNTSTCPDTFYDCLTNIYSECTTSQDYNVLTQLPDCEALRDPADCQQ